MMLSLSKICRIMLFLAVALLSISMLKAAEIPAGAGIQVHKPQILENIMVVGSRDNMDSLPGSAYYIDAEEIRALGYDDINRILREVPGVYIREEDGFGLFPNISLRGVDTTRSAKVTLMEDGVLTAPAPYAAPSAYYSPTPGRMHAIEVQKGASQIRYGPHSTGGVINYLSTPVPEQQTTFLRAQFGEDEDFRVHAFHGNTLDTAVGRVGYLIEAYVRSSGGFKVIDATPDFNNRGNTGFHNIEPTVKLSWEPRTAMYQRLEFKYGFTDRDADETYLGLSTEDFSDTPNRRYAASRFDEFVSEQHRTHLRHFISPAENLDVITTVYYNKFKRNWYKLNDIRALSGGLDTNLNLSAALAGAAGGAGLDCLRGELGCGLRVRANNREYSSHGIQSDVQLRFATASVGHELGFGIRYHRDIEDRFQWQDIFNQNDSGEITNVVRGIPGTQDDREGEVHALALYMQDSITLGNWSFTPGIRYERLDLENRNFRTGSFGETTLEMISGGIGATYDVNDAWQIFGGVHFGVSPPSPSGAVQRGLQEETSTGYELGLRYIGNGNIARAEITGFFTRFDDLIVVSNIGGAGAGIDENFGRVDSLGVEISGSYDLGRANGWPFSNRYFVSFTWTDAEQRNDAKSTNAESIFSFGEKGNKVPYIPEYQFSVGTSVDFVRWGGSITASFIDETFASANNVATEINGQGEPDARFGKTDSYELVDLSVYANPLDKVKVFAGVHNLFDKEYIVSRQPHGPRPGLPRSWFAGFEVVF